MGHYYVKPVKAKILLNYKKCDIYVHKNSQAIKKSGIDKNGKCDNWNQRHENSLYIVEDKKVPVLFRFALKRYFAVSILLAIYWRLRLIRIKHSTSIWAFS